MMYILKHFLSIFKSEMVLLKKKATPFKKQKPLTTFA